MLGKNKKGHAGLESPTHPFLNHPSILFLILIIYEGGFSGHHVKYKRSPSNVQCPCSLGHKIFKCVPFKSKYSNNRLWSNDRKEQSFSVIQNLKNTIYRQHLNHRYKFF